MKNLKLFLFLLLTFAVLSLSQASAYSSYYNDYSQNTYYEKHTYGYDGYTYVKRETQKDPWGERTTYVKINDYDDYPRYNSGYRDNYRNDLSDYWYYGYSRPTYINYARNRDYHDRSYYYNSGCVNTRYCRW